MIINTDDYMNIATYARYIGHSAVWITQLINRGKIKCIEISGIKFINYKEYGEKSNTCKDQYQDGQEGSIGKSCKTEIER